MPTYMQASDSGDWLRMTVIDIDDDYCSCDVILSWDDNAQRVLQKIFVGENGMKMTWEYGDL